MMIKVKPPKRAALRKGSSSCLPNIDDDDEDILNDINLSNLIVDGSFLSSTASLSPDENDEDLPVGIIKSKEKKKWKAGDLAWIKHRRYCFWPSYIKSVFNNKLSVYFICYNKFLANEKSFRYPATSKNIKKFDCSDSKNLIHEGREYMTSVDAQQDKNEDDQELYSLACFNDAVKLAEAYTLYRSNGEFANQKEELDFFRTKGLSPCLKLCNDDDGSPSLTRPLTPLDESSTLPTSADESPGVSTPHSEVSSLSSLIATTTSTPVSSQSENLNQDLMKVKKKTRKRKLLSDKQAFNNKSRKLVHYITNGNCEQHLLDIYHLKIPSLRMNQYLKVWDEISSGPCAKNMKTEVPYFCDGDQLREVAVYLQKFISEKLKDVVGLVRQDELLYSVFLPEATIFAIQKAFRKKSPVAVEMYEKSFTGRDSVVDAALSLPLSEEERASVERRNKEFLKKLKLGFT